MHHRYYFAALAAVGAIAAGHSAAARTPSDPFDTVSIRVSFGDLDLQSEGGARTMLQRIRHAAKSICDFNLDDEWQGRVRYMRCVRDITQHAVARLNNPLVTALNDGRSQKGRVVLAADRR